MLFSLFKISETISETHPLPLYLWRFSTHLVQSYPPFIGFLESSNPLTIPTPIYLELESKGIIGSNLRRCDIDINADDI